MPRCPTSDVPGLGPVPSVLLMLQHVLSDAGGMSAEGIFRRAASRSDADAAKVAINEGTFEGSDNPHLAAGLIKVRDGLGQVFSRAATLSHRSSCPCFPPFSHPNPLVFIVPSIGGAGFLTGTFPRFVCQPLPDLVSGAPALSTQRLHGGVVGNGCRPIGTRCLSSVLPLLPFCLFRFA